jgi:hypothetical protein
MPTIFDKFLFWWGHLGPAYYHGIAYSYCIMKSALRTINSTKITKKRITLIHSLNWLNLKIYQKLPSTSNSHKFFFLIQNLEFNHFYILSFLSFHLEKDSNLKLVRSVRSVQELKFQRHRQLSNIITPESLVGLRHVSNRRKDEKVIYDVGIECFLILHLNWSQKSRFPSMLNYVQNRIPAARPTLKSHKF